MVKISDCYKILECSRGDDKETIRKSYQRLSRQWHPDKNLEKVDEATEKMQCINEAYRMIMESKDFSDGKNGAQPDDPDYDENEDEDDDNVGFAARYEFEQFMHQMMFMMSHSGLHRGKRRPGGVPMEFFFAAASGFDFFDDDNFDDDDRDFFDRREREAEAARRRTWAREQAKAEAERIKKEKIRKKMEDEKEELRKWQEEKEKRQKEEKLMKERKKKAEEERAKLREERKRKEAEEELLKKEIEEKESQLREERAKKKAEDKKARKLAARAARRGAAAADTSTMTPSAKAVDDEQQKGENRVDSDCEDDDEGQRQSETRQKTTGASIESTNTILSKPIDATDPSTINGENAHVGNCQDPSPSTLSSSSFEPLKKGKKASETPEQRARRLERQKAAKAEKAAREEEERKRLKEEERAAEMRRLAELEEIALQQVLEKSKLEEAERQKSERTQIDQAQTRPQAAQISQQAKLQASTATFKPQSGGGSSSISAQQQQPPHPAPAKVFIFKSQQSAARPSVPMGPIGVGKGGRSRGPDSQAGPLGSTSSSPMAPPPPPPVQLTPQQQQRLSALRRKEEEDLKKAIELSLQEEEQRRERELRENALAAEEATTATAAATTGVAQGKRVPLEDLFRKYPKGVASLSTAHTNGESLESTQIGDMIQKNKELATNKHDNTNNKPNGLDELNFSKLGFNSEGSCSPFDRGLAGCSPLAPQQQSSAHSLQSAHTLQQSQQNKSIVLPPFDPLPVSSEVSAVGGEVLTWLGHFGMKLEFVNRLAGSRADGSDDVMYFVLNFLPGMGHMIAGHDDHNLKAISRGSGCVVLMRFQGEEEEAERDSGKNAASAKATTRAEVVHNAGELSITGQLDDVATAIMILDGILRKCRVFTEINTASGGALFNFKKNSHTQTSTASTQPAKTPEDTDTASSKTSTVGIPEYKALTPDFSPPVAFSSIRPFVSSPPTSTTTTSTSTCPVRSDGLTWLNQFQVYFSLVNRLKGPAMDGSKDQLHCTLTFPAELGPIVCGVDDQRLVVLRGGSGCLVTVRTAEPYSFGQCPVGTGAIDITGYPDNVRMFVGLLNAHLKDPTLVRFLCDNFLKPVSGQPPPVDPRVQSHPQQTTSPSSPTRTAMEGHAPHPSNVSTDSSNNLNGNYSSSSASPSQISGGGYNISLKPGETEMILRFPTRVAGFILGKGKTKIRSLQARTKTQIELLPKPYNAPDVINEKGEIMSLMHLRGPGHAVEAAYNEIEEDAAQLQATVEIVSVVDGQR